MADILPTTSDGEDTLSFKSGDISLTLTTYWNQIASMWFMDFQDSATTEVFSYGVALVPNNNVLSYSPTLTQLYGEYRVLDKTGDGDATDASLGSNDLLVRFDPGEFEKGAPDYDNPGLKAIPFDPSLVINF